MPTVGNVVGLQLDKSVGYEFERISAMLEPIARAFSSILDSIEPGQTICLKPNWIAPHHEFHEDEWEQIITHPTVIQAVIHAVSERLKSGRIILCDAPQTDSDFLQIREQTGLDNIKEWAASEWPSIDLEIIDLRREYWVQRGNVTVDRVKLPGDPRGAVLVDLGADSEFEGDEKSREYYGADYDFADTRQHHSDGRHEYLISKSVLSSDIFVNLPKLKTHKKAGITVSLKNLVGINADKNFLPHHTLGAPSSGGDEFPGNGSKRRLETKLSASFKKLIAKSGGKAPIWGPLARRMGTAVFGPTSEVIRSGNWWGNDTLWRMCLDLNKILLWYDADGKRRSSPRPYISIVDGIVAGEGNGPVAPDRIELGALIAGTDPVAVDLVCSRLMGFDWEKIPVLANAMKVKDHPLTDVTPETIEVMSDDPQRSVRGIEQLKPLTRFKPHFGWKGHIELDEDAPTARTNA